MTLTPLRPVNVGRFQFLYRPDNYLGDCYAGNGINYERHVVAKLRELLKPGCTFLDIGAAWGFYTLVANEITDRNCTVISVEPNPYSVEVICANIRHNGIKGAVVLSTAASDRFGVVEYQGTFDNVLGKTKADLPGDKVLCVPLGFVVSLPDVIKIDIEGHEPQAIQGMATKLIDFHPPLITEFCPSALIECGNNPRVYLELLFLADYKHWELLDRELKPNPKGEGIDSLLPYLRFDDPNFVEDILFTA